MATVPHCHTPPVAQRIIVVNAGPEALDMIEPTVERGTYEVDCVEFARAYSRIKKLQPDMVVVCTRIEDAEAFQLLSILMLDPKTSEIPVLTFTTEHEGQEGTPLTSPFAEDEDETRRHRLTLRMN